MLGTNSSISRGPSCPSDCEIGHIGSDQRALVLVYAKTADDKTLLLGRVTSVLDRSTVDGKRTLLIEANCWQPTKTIMPNSEVLRRQQEAAAA
jgi:hypothetical protein